jgi:group I intron endonuclease
MKRHNHKELPCVYMILCIKSGRYYIGKTSDAWRRWEEHYTSLKFGSYAKDPDKGKTLMQEDWNEYGRANFAFIALCERSNKALRDELEAYLITLTNPLYNTVLSDKDGKTAHYEAVKELVKEFLYSWLPFQLREMPLNKAYNSANSSKG